MLYHPLLDTFVCAADCGSLSRAAEKLFLSPTAVKKQLDSLEKLLDLQLLERTHQGVKLTPAGEALYRDALYLAEYSRSALEKARKLAGNPPVGAAGRHLHTEPLQGPDGCVGPAGKPLSPVPAAGAAF